MKNFTQTFFVALLALLGFSVNAAADTEFNFNAMDVAVSSGSGEDLTHDGDITEAWVLTLDGVTLTVSPADEGVTNPNRFWGTNAGPQLRCYSGSITIESETAFQSIVFDAPSKFNVTPDVGTIEGTTWNGNATKVVFTVNGNTQINKITVSAEAAQDPGIPEAADFAAFKALEKGTEAKLLLKDAFVTAVSGENAYVQDATGALYFYKSGLTLEAGKKLNGSVTGKLDIYNNLPEFVKTSNTNGDDITATDGTVDPKKVTVAEALAAENISMLVTLKAVAIEEDGGKYYAVDGDDKVQIYDQFKVLPSEFVYPETADITAIVGMYKGTPQLYPIDANSISEAELLPEADFADGKYILANLVSAKFWGAGNSWGTQATLTDHPEYITLLKQPDGTYFLESQVTNGGESYYFNGDYMDQTPPANLTIKTAVLIGENDLDGSPVYAYTISNDGNYFGWDGESTVLGKNLPADSENALWIIASYEQAVAGLASATEEDPMDATFLILDPNFSRNHRNQAAWEFSSETADGGTNFNICGGANENKCAESYHAKFALRQTLEGVPNGIYELVAQGFYRQDGEDNENLPYFYINDAKGVFPVLTGAENSMNDASASFSTGLYTTDPIRVVVTDGKITLGAKNDENLNLWCIWDNFQLYYLGEADPNVLDLTINHKREIGLGYAPTSATVDFAEAKAFLGVEEVTTDMLSFVNPDGTKIPYDAYMAANYDGWCNGDGFAENWGANTKICVKFFEAIPDGTFTFYDMNNADEVGKTYKVKWCLASGEKSVRYAINVTFVQPEQKELEVVESGVIAEVVYDNTEPSYVEKQVVLSDEQVAAICEVLGISSLSEAAVYGYNPTTKELVKNHAGYDGWRDANGDFHNWTGNAEVPACVKWTDGQTYLCYNIQGCNPQTIKCYWAPANDVKAALVEIDFIYTGAADDDPELVAPEGWTSLITNGNLASDDVANFFSKEAPASNPSPSIITAGAGKNGSRGITVQSADNPAQGWDTQFFIRFNESLPEGTKLHVEFDYKADKEAAASTQSHTEPGSYIHWAAIGTVSFTPEWQHYVADVTVEGAMADMQTIAFNLAEEATATLYSFDNFGIWMQKPAPVDDWVNILANSDLEGTDASSFFSKEAPSTDVVPSTIYDGAGVDGSRGIKVTSPAGASQDWDTQFWIYLPCTLPEGTKYLVEFDYKADKDASADTQAHAEPGNYIFYSMIGSPSFTTEWQHYSKMGSITADQAGSDDKLMRSIAFNLSKDKANDVTFFFDNIKFCVEKAFYETGIFEVPAVEKTVNAIYNLRGQKVDKPTKGGIYIINGKKVVVK